MGNDQGPRGSSVTQTPFFGRSVISPIGSTDVAGCEPRPVALGDGGDDDLRFGEREAVANANPRAAAEGHIGETRAAGDGGRREAFGVEALGLRPELRIAVIAWMLMVTEAPGGIRIAAEVVLADRAPPMVCAGG